jgi:hypothetical protein
MVRQSIAPQVKEEANDASGHDLVDFAFITLARSPYPTITLTTSEQQSMVDGQGYCRSIYLDMVNKS